MSELVRTTVYISKENKELLNTISFITKESKTSMLNTALTKHFETLVKEKGLEKLIEEINSKNKK
jgi:flagellar basal body-associated protein FliL